MSRNSAYSSFNNLSQNSRLPIRLISPVFGHLSPEAANQYSLTSRLPYYFLFLMLDGHARFKVDLEEIDIVTNEFLFSLPQQLQQLPDTMQDNQYYKLGFNDECLSRLPKHYPFLLNPLNQHKICLHPAVVIRLKTIFELLLGLLCTPDTEPELILAHLNSLLTEINAAYFATHQQPVNEKLSKYLGFKVFVENNLTEHPTIANIAEGLALSTDSLYQIVKHYSGLSPKEFITNRLILEARRRIHYGEKSSVKELAFELGFNDPDYFSRLFKKVTGKTVASFFRDLS